MKHLPKELKNRHPFSFEIYANYCDNYNSNFKVNIKCEKCGKEVKIKWSVLNKRSEELRKKQICNFCVCKIKVQQYKNIPNELQNIGLKENPISFEQYLKYKDEYSNGSKKWIKINCLNCKKESLVQWRKIRNRNYGKDLPICSNCILKYTVNNEVWRNKNREAQIIVQNKLKTIEKHRKSQHEKMKIDKNYRDKKLSSRRYSLAGTYKGIKFDSSFELSFLVYYEHLPIERCDFEIPYEYKNKNSLYYPDFVVYFPDGKYLVEIKGIKEEIVDVKAKFAKDFIKDKDFKGYKLLYYDDLKSLTNFVFYDSKEKIELLDKNKLVISKTPKNWFNV